MREYPKRHAGHNPLLPPPNPAPTWSAAQRRAVMGRENPAFRDGSGQKRRQRREVKTKQTRARLAAALSGEHRYRGADDHLYSLREILHAPVPAGRTELRTEQHRARVMLNLVVQHGPANGWGVAQEEAAGAGEHHSPFIVAKTSEKKWRWWRAMAAGLFQLVAYIAARWGKPVPSHSTARDCASNQEAQDLAPVGNLEVEPSVSRDRWALDKATLASWSQQAWAM